MQRRLMVGGALSFIAFGLLCAVLAVDTYLDAGWAWRPPIATLTFGGLSLTAMGTLILVAALRKG
ncbi:hypothetical protein [Nocardiopsis trehalosi]|uniref:hypothetical protein n=1 Tax=Nocardiopsis trehalosi TaxID=109329 RepID=UPI0012FCAE5A|nr:hypothetical protein [Nocardiopsis trehalosi]